LSDNKKYYYIKLKDNYFDQDNIKILESVKNGHIYSLIIVKLYLKATKYGGQLRMTESIPYDPSKMDILANVLNHDIAHVKEAIKLASELGIISILDTGAIWMDEIQNFIGNSSNEADRIREYRTKLKGNNVQMYDKSTPKKEIELDKELKKDKEIKAKTVSIPINLSDSLSSKLKEFIDYRKQIKKPLKTDRSINSLVNNIGKEFVNEEHLIQCIDHVMDNEWQKPKGEYVKYSSPVDDEEVANIW